MRSVNFTKTFYATSQRLSSNHKHRISALVDHYTKNQQHPGGKDKVSGGQYAGKNFKHFHIAEPDLLLLYQLTNTSITLVAVGTHRDFFGTNEAAFLASIADELFDSTNKIRNHIDIIESISKNGNTIH